MNATGEQSRPSLIITEMKGFEPVYSYRSASTGSSPAARLAG